VYLIGDILEDIFGDVNRGIADIKKPQLRG
jgi:hypothetical protein